MNAELFYVLCTPLFALLALELWAGWARRPAAWRWALGLLAAALACDAARILLERVADDAGGPRPRTVGWVLAGLLALLALRSWRALPPCGTARRSSNAGLTRLPSRPGSSALGSRTRIPCRSPPAFATWLPSPP